MDEQQLRTRQRRMDVMTLDDGTKVDKPERCPECGYDFMIAEFPDNENGVDRFWLCRNQDCCEEIRPEGIVEKGENQQ